MLSLLDVPESATRQVRLTRWGHAMQISRPGLIFNGIVETAARPIDNKVFFVNQDNWALTRSGEFRFRCQERHGHDPANVMTSSQRD
jgi:hypothetical protein